jgi:hypothetical protein
MLHAICATLVVVATLAQLSILRQSTQRHELAGIQQAAAGAAFRSSLESRY